MPQPPENNANASIQQAAEKHAAEILTRRDKLAVAKAKLYK